MKRIYIIYIVAVFVSLFAVSCEPVNGIEPEFPVKDKTILIYMVGNNNLSTNAEINLADLKKGYVPSDDNLLVYYHTPVQSPILLQLKTGKNGDVVQDTVYRFPQRNSATAESLKSALQVTNTMFPANEYGLFLWSHGTGWLPSGHYSKSFGEESGVEMEIVDMVKAIPYKLSFVVFDACLMGCVEVAYQMRNSVDYVIASPTEILATGFPYSKIMRHLFRTPSDYVSVAKEYYMYYNSHQNDQSRFATISVVKTSELENLAAETKKIFDKYRRNISNLDHNSVQKYYRFNKHWFFDFGDFIKSIAGDEDAAPVIGALEKAVVYKAATLKFLDLNIDPSKYTGLSTYIPISPSDPVLNAFYVKFDWNKDTGMILAN